jgi:tRNA A-37 threonylcarbamoyl transferase component Bud32/tetratricopeptide (TPR) repeat protein
MATTDLATPEREARLEEVLAAYFDAVDAGQPDDRETLLARYPELATELATFFSEQERLLELASPLRSLWQAEQAVTPLLRQPTSTPEGADALSPDQPPRSFGDYELLEVIGRGGMGVVFKARQKSLNRHVALKLLRRDRWAEAADAQRFRNEAEMVAQLDHPHLVPIYEVGEHDGRLFFSMKLIDGGSLAEQLGRFRDDPRSAAQLVAEVARAVHHAHQRGILHRDLKPSNVLLDHDGQPHVVDFGLAKRIEADGSLTRSGALVGTPNYMAPEQTTGQRGAVTTATDVYGLGAVLYALLTGGPPFQGEDVLATLVQVHEGEPRPPSRVNRKVDRDLETVCLKCLAKDPGRRYASAAELADDLERWLAGESVRARRAGRWVRAWKWVRRNPTLLALLAVVVLSAWAAVAGLVWHNGRLRAEAEKTAQERDEARKSRRAARRAVNDMYTRVGEEWLADTPHMTDVQRDFLTKAMEFYEEVVRDPGAEPEDRLELGRALSRIAYLRGNLAQHSEAEASLRESARVLEALVAEFSDVPEYRLELVRTYNRLGRFLVNVDQFLESEDVLNRARTQAEGLHRSYPERPDYRVELARVLVNQRELLQRTGCLATAREVGRQARDQARELVADQPAGAGPRELLAATTLNLGVLHLEMNHPSEAAESFRDAVGVLEPLALESPHRPSIRRMLASSLESLGALLLEAAEVEEAEKSVGRSVELRRKLRDDFPTLPHYWHALASGSALHGGILARLGRFADAEAALAEALPLQEKVVEETGIGRRREELAVFTATLAWLRLREPRPAPAL